MRPLDARLGRVEGRRAAANAETSSGEARQRRLWRTKAAIGSLIREVLECRGIDPAGIPRLALADEATAALAAIPDLPELQRADRETLPPAQGQGRAHADAFNAKITAMTQAAAAALPDLANASFAQLFAWALAVSAGATDAHITSSGERCRGQAARVPATPWSPENS
jgi:hypothetical protein